MWVLGIVGKSAQTHLDHFAAVVTLVKHSLYSTIVMVWKLDDQCMPLPSPNIPTSDVDECATNNGRGPCDQNCTRTPVGLYQCSCSIGYALASNVISCNGECC